MTKPGHEAPLFDNANPADMSSHAEEDQLRIGQDVPEPVRIQIKDLSSDLLTQGQKESVEQYIDSDSVSHQQALERRVSRSKSDRIFGAVEARRLAGEAGQHAQVRRANEQQTVTPMDQAVEEMKASYVKDDPPKAA